MDGLSTLFAPDRIAVVGASERAGSVGRAVTQNLLDGFAGEVLAVNPNRERVLGLPCHDHVAETGADLAVVAVPASAAVEVVRDAGAAGVENVVVITAGFSEAGEADRERALVGAAGEHDLNLVGPNSLGVLSTESGMNATFGPRDAAPGGISFMSQSGALVTAVLDWAGDRELGFRHVVSLGNKAVLDETDFVRAWGTDPGTDVVLGYLEGVADGRAFVEAAREVTPETPVVVLKSGRTEAGASAAASHTGAMAGSEAAARAGFEQAGVLRAESVQELFDYAAILAGQPLPSGDVAVVTNAGGPGVMATDAVGDTDLELATLAAETRADLVAALPSAASVHNPVDIVGDAPVERFADALEVTLADDNVGMAVVVACPTATFAFDDLAAELCRVQAEAGVPVAAVLMGGESTATAAATLAEAGVPTYFDPARAVDALAALARYAAVRDREHSPPRRFDVDRERARAVLDRAAADNRRLLGVESMDLLAAYGVSTPAGAVVDSPDEAIAVADHLGAPVVMKVVSPDISHKSDIGGVEVGVERAAVADTYETLVARARNYRPDATVLGVQVQELVDTSRGVEVLVGISRDPQFGPLVVTGLGGVFVEVLDDTATRLAPVSASEVRGMLAELRSRPLLHGARGRDPVDVDALVETVQRISQLAVEFPAIAELDINPVVALPDGEGVSALDLRLTLDPDP